MFTKFWRYFKKIVRKLKIDVRKILKKKYIIFAAILKKNFNKFWETFKSFFKVLKSLLENFEKKNVAEMEIQRNFRKWATSQ